MNDLAAIVPPAIVCVAFIFGAWMLLRRELAPKRRHRAEADDGPADEEHEPGERNET